MRRLVFGLVVVLVFAGTVQMSAEMARADLGGILEHVPGDTDRDGDVDFTDFNALANNYTGTVDGGGKLWGDGDFDGDFDVDFTDFNALANNYTGTQEHTHTPEPSTFIVWSLLGALGVAAGWWRRRRAA